MRISKGSGSQSTGSANPGWIVVVERCVTQHRREGTTFNDVSGRILIISKACTDFSK
jgi:hypothetical protein